MIPKKIHFTWFSGDPYPQNIADCIESWKRMLPDYELVKWDYDKIKDIDVTFLKEALAERKWAFAADYVRLYAVFHEGGIYLDTDVMVYQSFNNLLSNSCFIGRETSWHIEGHETASYLSSHCFGAVAGHPFIKETLDYYESIHFLKSSLPTINKQLRFDMTIIPYVQAILAEQYGYDWNYSADSIQKLSNKVTVYPHTYFDTTFKGAKTPHYCTHLAVGSWRERAMRDTNYNWKYKIQWRITAVVETILKKFGYAMIKLT